ncbi:LOW QUALITY PROTEIN: hypothetical protein JCM24511_08088 [Saitozyma sp. JCM 24511]|nr:LOW QUALITY PROTEIN: hypothetical protein JCM24511_08088 [Saitozyma sp. JCM 24511]
MDCKPEPQQIRAGQRARKPSNLLSQQGSRILLRLPRLLDMISLRHVVSLLPPYRPIWPVEERLPPHGDRFGLQRDQTAGSREIRAGDGKRAM